jgi:hypothetical protein
MEIRNNYNGNGIRFLKDIVFGARGTDDLEIRCKVCNVLHYVESVYGIKDFKVKYNTHNE